MSARDPSKKIPLLQRLNPLSRANPRPVPVDAGTCPEAEASWYSKLTWGWMTELLYVGYTRPLEAGDIWHVEPSRQSRNLSKTLQENFNRRKRNGGRFPLFWALSDSHRWTFWSAGLMKLTGDTILTLNTLLIKYIIEYVGEAYVASRGGPPAPSIGRGIGLAIGLFLMQLASSVLQHHFFYRSMLTGALSRSGLIACIYKKSLVLSNKSRIEYTNGKITNLMSTDTFRIDFAAGYAHMLWTSIVQMLVILTILLINLGPSALAGFGLLVLSAPIMSKVVQKLAAKRKESTKFTDARVRLMQEILSSMRIIKFYAWENSFLQKVSLLRVAEMKIVRFLLITRSAVNAVAITIPVFATILAFVTYSLTGHSLAPGPIFSSLALFNLLRMPLMFLPLVFSSMTDAHISLMRIQEMLGADEIELDAQSEASDAEKSGSYAISIKSGEFCWEDQVNDVKPPSTPIAGKSLRRRLFGSSRSKTAPQGTKGDELQSQSGSQIVSHKSSESDATELADEMIQLSKTLSHASGNDQIASPEGLTQSSDTPYVDPVDRKFADTTEAKVQDIASATNYATFAVRDLNLEIKRGELVAIVGAVGSGKSSILSALVGEMRKANGQVVINGTVGFCAQVPWIMNATVKDNILFGREYDEDRYNAVIRASALGPDLEILPDGDLTEIGERGITISGGQKQRLNIARAAYFDADVILLDDPLSAVDAHVGNHLFEKCISGLLKDKTRLLVTHQLHFLPMVDRILVVKDGTIVEEGSYSHLVEQGEDFARILRDFGSKDEATKETEEEAIESVAAETPQDPKKITKQLLTTEDRETGAVSAAVYKGYLEKGGGLWTLPILLLITGLAQVAQVGNNLWLSFWSRRQFEGRTDKFYIGIYASFGFAQAFAYFALGFGVTVIGNRASSGMHSSAVRRVLQAPMSFFDTTPQGRIINRFSKDIDTMDNLLSDSFRMFLTTFSSIVGSFILSIVIYHYFAAALGPLLIMFYLFALYYRASAREIKRIDSVLRSSVYAQFGETLTGLSTVRAYREQDRFIAMNEKFIDRMNGAYLLTITNQRWLGIRLDFTGTLLILVVAILAVTSRFNVDPATTGLVLSYTMQVTGMIGWMVRQFAEVENNMNASERVFHYGSKLEIEADFTSDNPPADSWPSAGAIDFVNVDLAYRPGLPLVLNSLNLSIKAGESVGIVGRTGAGKSSILAALYRMCELSAGKITIDGLDVSTIGLHELRSKLSIIPQDPVLFAGTIRSNLDPNDTYSDHEIWQALLKTHFVHGELGEGVGLITLDSSVDDEGLNFSLGQRQLLAMARALLRKTKILVLDEATSSVDFETDSLIQATIQNEFRNATLLCIAHRLKTIIHYDKICVMDKGRVAEFDTPKALFDSGGIFRSMCDRSSIVL